MFRISPDSLTSFNLENHTKSSYHIKTIEKFKDKIIIYCGSEIEQFISERKYELYRNSDGILFISEIVPTGINNDEATIFLAKFTDNKYFIKGYEEFIL